MSIATGSNDLAAITNVPCVALAKCMKATDQVRAQTSQVQTIGRPHSRGRIGYNQNDLADLSDCRNQLKLALSKLATIHQEFAEASSEVEQRRLDQRLKKLNHLQAGFSSRIAEFNHRLLKTEPGPDLTGLAWDVNSLKRSAGKWQSVHKNISKELSLRAGSF